MGLSEKGKLAPKVLKRRGPILGFMAWRKPIESSLELEFSLNDGSNLIGFLIINSNFPFNPHFINLIIAPVKGFLNSMYFGHGDAKWVHESNCRGLIRRK
jgi:hypothetical protein